METTQQKTYPAVDAKVDANLAAELEQLDERALLRTIFEQFGHRAAIGTSLQKTGIVTIDLAFDMGTEPRIFFIDTNLHNVETYALLQEVEDMYGTKIERFCPDPDDVEALYQEFGQYPHYFAAGRKKCCEVRKVRPNEDALSTVDVWISGLRSDQSESRKENAKRIAIVEQNGRDLLKVNPLFEWTEAQIDEYARERGLPHNALYDYASPYGERYTVIGCEPCHIPVKEGWPKRAGKFPWELGSEKECGLHKCGLHKDGSGI